MTHSQVSFAQMTLILLFILVTLISSYSDLEKQRSPGSQENMKTKFDIYDFSRSDPNKQKHLTIILKSLESLKVLDSNRKSCYTLSKIVKTKTVQNVKANEWKIGIEFFVSELHSKEDKSPEEQPSRNENKTVSSDQSSSNGTNTSKSDIVQQPPKLPTNGCHSSQGISISTSDHDGIPTESDDASSKTSGAADRVNSGKNGVRVPYKRKNTLSSLLGFNFDLVMFDLIHWEKCSKKIIEIN